MPVELLDLNVGHSIIRGHKPDNLPLEAIDRIQKEAKRENFASFGLFDTSTPNYYTYYPSVKAEDLNPQDAEFVYPVFRMLSSIVIYPTRLAIDFTEGNVLKNSMPLLKGQSLYVDHEMTTGNVMGSIMDVFWQEAYVTDGVKVPAGINGLLMIDGKSNPRIARAVMMNPPSIHSSSVQIQFAWKPSHKFKDQNEFMAKLGTYDAKGVLVRKVVEEVLRYAENSLVPHGMDPFAKKLNNGKIVLAKSAGKVYAMQFSEKELARDPFMAVTTTPDHTPYHLASMNFSEIVDTTPTNITDTQQLNDTVMFEQMLESLGFTAEQFADEAALTAHIQAQLTALAERTTEVETLTGTVAERDATIVTLNETVTERDATITSLNEKVTTLTTLAEGEVGKIRTSAKKFYNLVKGDKADSALLTSIDAMGAEAANAILTEYEQQYNTLVPLTCNACHSTDVTRKASTTPGEGTAPVNFMDKIRDDAAKAATKKFVEAK
jgi:uncharacterized coiled-coil protein SlyX